MQTFEITKEELKTLLKGLPFATSCKLPDEVLPDIIELKGEAVEEKKERCSHCVENKFYGVNRCCDCKPPQQIEELNYIKTDFGAFMVWMLERQNKRVGMYMGDTIDDLPRLFNEFNEQQT